MRRHVLCAWFEVLWAASMLVVLLVLATHTVHDVVFHVAGCYAIASAVLAWRLL